MHHVLALLLHIGAAYVVPSDNEKIIYVQDNFVLPAVSELDIPVEHQHLPSDTVNELACFQCRFKLAIMARYNPAAPKKMLCNSCYETVNDIGNEYQRHLFLNPFERQVMQNIINMLQGKDHHFKDTPSPLVTNFYTNSRRRSCIYVSMYVCPGVFVAGREPTAPDRRGTSSAGAAVVPFGRARAEQRALGAARLPAGSVCARVRPRGWKYKGRNARKGDCMRAVQKKFEQRAAEEPVSGAQVVLCWGPRAGGAAWGLTCSVETPETSQGGT